MTDIVERLKAEVKYDELWDDRLNMTDEERLLDEAAAEIMRLQALAGYLAEALIESGCVEAEDAPWLDLVKPEWIVR